MRHVAAELPLLHSAIWNEDNRRFWPGLCTIDILMAALIAAGLSP